MGNLVSKILNETLWILSDIDVEDSVHYSICLYYNCLGLFHQGIPPLITHCSGSCWGDVINDELNRLVHMRNPI